MISRDDPDAAARWRRMERIFEATVDLPPEECERVLQRECGSDVEMRSALEDMLAADREHDDFLVSPAPAPLPPPPSEPDHIGAYQVIRALGAGGMGTVYLAQRDDDHFEHRVAIKVIRPGLDTVELRRRFHAERRVLARLRHENIARLFDGGDWEGRPYLVMEYVSGQPLDDFCDRRRLDLDQRIRIFLDVCAGVSHAHRNLIVHRDLKPANILVGDDGVPKLLDFGIAKVLDERDGDAPALTEVVGSRLTPEYASPEQLRGDPVTTASDVYSLGVVLYELLSGRKPHRRSSPAALASRSSADADAPARPSRVVRIDLDTAATSTEIADARGTVPAKLARRLEGDLENIVLMALRSEPERRYPTVAAMVDDLQRYLSGLPVTATRDSFGYRAGKLIRRHRGLTALTTALVLTLIGGALGMGWFARYALQERDVAREAKASAEEEAERSRVEAYKASQATRFVHRMLAAVTPEHEGREVTVREMLDHAGAIVGQELTGEPEVEAEIRTTLGFAYQGLGMLDAAAPHVAAALECAKAARLPPTRVGSALLALGSLHLARRDLQSAEPHLREAWSLFRSNPDHTGPRDGRRDQLQGEASASDKLAELCRLRGDFAGAERLLLRALQIRREVLGDRHLDLANTLTALGVLLYDQGRYDESETAFREAFDIKASHPDASPISVATEVNNLAHFQRLMGQHQTALEMQQRAVDLFRSALDGDHPILATLLQGLGSTHLTLGHHRQALQLLSEAAAMQRRLFPAGHPSLASTLVAQGEALVRAGQPEEAVVVATEALAMMEARLGRDNHETADALHVLGEAQHLAGDLERAESTLTEALRIRRATIGADHPDAAQTMAALGTLYARTDRADLARPLLTDAITALTRALAPSHPDVVRVREQLARLAP